MATNMLANVLITAVISNGFLATASPVVPAKPQHPTAYTKTYGKKVEMEGVIEGPSDPPYELSKDLLEISPLHGKNFWKPSLPSSWKIKRACFWKYCVGASSI